MCGGDIKTISNDMATILFLLLCTHVYNQINYT